MSRAACCKCLQPNDPSPFEIVQLGWYDGVTSGMARCRTCDTTYSFEMLSWDIEREVRVYGFREVTREGHASVAQLHAAPVPGVEDRDQHYEALRRRVSEACATNFEWTLFIASADLDDRVITARYVTFDSWMKILGGEPGEPETAP